MFNWLTRSVYVSIQYYIISYMHEALCEKSCTSLTFYSIIYDCPILLITLCRQLSCFLLLLNLCLVDTLEHFDPLSFLEGCSGSHDSLYYFSSIDVLELMVADFFEYPQFPRFFIRVKG